MKLASFEVRNYRSIVKSQQLVLDEHLTVIVGANNEGKSNLLRALSVALSILNKVKIYGTNISNTSIQEFYNRDDDFPKVKVSSPTTFLKLIFELSDNDRQEFWNTCGLTTNSRLPLVIEIDSLQPYFRVPKQGKGKDNYIKKSPSIARFISQNFDFQYIPAIRTGSQSMEVVMNLLEKELKAMEVIPEYIAAIDQIRQIQKPILEKIEENLRNQLSVLLPSVASVKIETPFIVKGVQNNKFFRNRESRLIIDDGVPTDIESKGDGIKSLVAIALMRSGEKFGSNIVAIEEPETHLHPSAIKQLYSVLIEIAKQHQVIITTHSPLLVSKSKLSSNIIVSKSMAVPASSIETIRTALGVELSDNLVNTEFVVLAEGSKDITILKSYIKRFFPRIQTAIEASRISFDDMGGTGNLPYKISTLNAQIMQHIVIFDDDKSGRSMISKARSATGQSSDRLFVIARPDRSESEIEDIIDPAIYWEHLCTHYGGKFSLVDFEASPKKWSDRMKDVFKGAGKPYDESTESSIKSFVARRVEESDGDFVLESSKNLMISIFASIENILSIES